MICTANQILLACQIKKDYMGRTCSTQEIGEAYNGPLWGDLKEGYLGRTRHRQEDNNIIDIQNVQRQPDWTDVGQQKDNWQAVVNVVFKIWVP